MNWFQYLLQGNLYLILFYGFYVLLLRNETFFRLNRIYLIAGAIISFLIPLIQFELVQSLFITGQIRHTTETFNTILLPAVVISPVVKNEFTILQILTIVYIVGLSIFLTRFIWQLIRIKYAFKSDRSGQAFSFFNRISIDPLLPARQIIMQHEQAHVRQWHSADVLFFELIASINWFNPVVYIYKNAIRHIHEFIADEVAVEQKSSKSEYALLLLENTFGIQSQQLINNFFNHSLLKRRIFMLSKTKSRKIAILKYGLSASLFAAMLIFSAATGKKGEAVAILSKLTVRNSLTAERNNNSTNYKTLKNVDLKKEIISNDKVSSSEEISRISSEEVFKADSAYNDKPLPSEETKIISFSPVTFQTDTVYKMESVQILPQFPGAPAAWGQFLQGYNYPALARENNVSGTVYVSFVVEKDGSLTDIKVVRDIGFGTGEEAVRLLKTSPKWSSGLHNGLKVRVAYTQPMRLALQ